MEMQRQRVLTLHFLDGSRIIFNFPEQTTNAMAKKLRMDEFLASNHVLIEADGSLLMFPMANIKYIQLSKEDTGAFDEAHFPKLVIRNATIVG